MKNEKRYVDPIKESLIIAKSNVSRTNANVVAYEQYLQMANVLKAENMPIQGKVIIQLRGVQVAFHADENEIKSIANNFSTGGIF